METQEWEFEPEYNRITAVEPGNCRITIADKIYGINERDWIANGKLIAMAPRLAEFAHIVLSTATIETNRQVLLEAEAIINEMDIIRTNL